MGLSLAEAWRISPRSMRLVSRARRESALDEHEQRIHASYAAAYFSGLKRLDGRALKKMLPKRGRQRQAMTAEEAIAQNDAWANGINRRVARAGEAAKAAQG